MKPTFAEIVRRRRAVRVYDAAHGVDAATVRDCIELATLAPNSTNLQLWSFCHVVSAEKLDALAEACFRQNAAKTAQQMVVFVVRRDLWRTRAAWNLSAVSALLRGQNHERSETRIRQAKNYFTRLIPFVYVDVFGVLGMLKKGLANIIGLFRPVYRQLSAADTRIMAHKSCALAAQTFMLAMSAEGYDTCPLEGFDSRRVQKILQLPRGSEINMIVSCGVRDEEKGVYFERHRVPFDEVYTQV
ncbi:MAG: nitroreductase family protein [Neisseria sp.]|nr:nitroreductase family protein [Neisseria sp.]